MWQLGCAAVLRLVDLLQRTASVVECLELAVLCDGVVRAESVGGGRRDGPEHECQQQLGHDLLAAHGQWEAERSVWRWLASSSGLTTQQRHERRVPVCFVAKSDIERQR